MLPAPLPALVGTATGFSPAPWSEVSVVTGVVVLTGSICVGVGEELCFRGILVTALHAHHTEIVVLLVPSVMPGLARPADEVADGLSPSRSCWRRSSA